jgi:hypothetical protein
MGVVPPDGGFLEFQFGYWDSLKKGLLSGERLQLALRRMEAAYLEQHKREYELTKHVSLALLDPIALLRLRETGQCSVSLPEEIFDLDHPGHYMRRIKTAGLTAACVAGPYTTVGATLTLHSARIRTSSVVQGSYADDENYVTTVGIMQSVATSGQQNDSGLFESNLRDERLLPFEGFGAISNWHLDLPGEFRQFDYDTISDVILHLRYTARSGGAALGQAAIEAFQEGALNTLPLGKNGEHSGLFRFFSLRRDFSAEWHRFLHVADGAAHSVVLDLSRGRFPYLVQALASIEVTAAQLYLKPRADGGRGPGDGVAKPAPDGRRGRHGRRCSVRRGRQPHPRCAACPAGGLARQRARWLGTGVGRPPGARLRGPGGPVDHPRVPRLGLTCAHRDAGTSPGPTSLTPPECHLLVLFPPRYDDDLLVIGSSAHWKHGNYGRQEEHVLALQAQGSRILDHRSRWVL